MLKKSPINKYSDYIVSSNLFQTIHGYPKITNIAWANMLEHTM